VIAFAVSDTGIGIPGHRHQMVFEAFQQVKRRNSGTEGTGLGLAICRGIVEAHGGRIWIEDGAHGRGTRVVFTLPIGDEAQLPTESDAAPQSSTTEEAAPSLKSNA
jgi:two-component system sensor histidine kinase KdpD